MTNFVDKDGYVDFDALRAAIIEFADNDTEYGWTTVYSEGKNYRFPKRALMHHVFRKMKPVQDMLPEYEAFSPYGCKMGGDDPFHTDCWLGAGFDIETAYDYGTPEHDAYHEASWAIEREMKKKFTFDFVVLADGLTSNIDLSYLNFNVFQYDGPLKENVWSSTHIDCADPPEDEWGPYRAVCIPHAGIEYDLACRNADVIITEKGGPLAHLSTVSRERGKLLIRVDNAIERFPFYSRLRIDLDDWILEPRK